MQLTAHMRRHFYCYKILVAECSDYNKWKDFDSQSAKADSEEIEMIRLLKLNKIW